LTKREQILITMLHRFHEARDPAFGRDGMPGDGQGYAHMPSTWNGSYRELERCLVALRDAAPVSYVHLMARHVTRTERVKLLRFVNGKPVLPPRCEVVAGSVSIGEQYATCRVLEYPDWVRDEMVDHGLAWVSREFRGEPFLPEEFAQVA